MHCPYFEQQVCRSCQLLDQPYAATLESKQHLLQTLFPAAELRDITPTQQVPGSRIRARLAVFGGPEQPRFGFLNDQKQVVAVDQCPLHHPRINQLVQELPELIAAARLVPWSMAEDRGELKYVIITYSPTQQQLMLQLVLRSREAVDRIRRVWQQRQLPLLNDVLVLSVNIQPVRSSALNGDTELPISECQQLPLRFGDSMLLYAPRSFVQTNFQVAEQLYQRAASLLQSRQPHSLLDLYCGTGAFSLTAADAALPVLGLDTSTDSIACANAAASAQQLPQARFETCADERDPAQQLSQLLQQLTSQPVSGWDAVICNPPRRGLDEATRQLILQLQPRVLLYSSCQPLTLQRDEALLASRYRIVQLEPFDMFPFTPHLEVLALFAPR